MSLLERVLKNMLYDVHVKCTNCNQEETVRIMKSTNVIDGLKYKRCSYCGTSNLVTSF